MLDNTALCERMKKMHKTKAQCARAAGMSPQTLNSKLKGKNKIKPQEIKMLCDFLEIDTGEVFDFFTYTEFM